MMIDQLINAAAPHVKHRLWIVSDLQQHLPERARYCMTRAMDDFTSLNLPVEAVCYLGDATEGDHLPFIHEMAEMQYQQFSRVDAPKFYVVGNHDFDYYRNHRNTLPAMCIPFVEYMRSKPGWHVPTDMQRMHYVQDMGDYALCFLTDHAAPDGSWYTHHGVIQRGEDVYPYDEAAYRAIMDEINHLGKPVLTLSHYSFAGGNRAAALFDRFLPLPENVRIHFYGHAHIGDAKWAGKDCHRKIACVDNQAIMQINVASLENDRGSAVRSVIVEWYDMDEIGVLFRNHSLHCWDDYLVVRAGEGQRCYHD